jgi:hypothetical protein
MKYILDVTGIHKDVWHNFIGHVIELFVDMHRLPDLNTVLITELSKYKGLISNKGLSFETEEDATYFVLKWN